MDNNFNKLDAERDELTNVLTKDAMISCCRQLIDKKAPFSFAFIDVDNFSYINDTFGEHGGNKVLCDIADKLVSIIGGSGIVARYGGDKFAMILNEIVSYDEIWNICHNILVKTNEIELPEIGNQTLTVTIGLDRFPENAESYEELIVCAEKALFRGKSKGRNCFIIYLPEKHASIVPKTEKQRAAGSLNIHSNVFKFLTTSDDLSAGITNLFNFFSSYFEIDHICIQTEDSVLFQKVHQLSKNMNFEHIPHELINASINKLTGVLYVSDTKNLLRSKHERLYEIFERQAVTASCFCEISYRGEIYGMLRADMTGRDGVNRLFQYSDLDLLLMAAKTIAMILHYTGKKPGDL